jgi:hypothetical protein
LRVVSVGVPSCPRILVLFLHRELSLSPLC